MTTGKYTKNQLAKYNLQYEMRFKYQSAFQRCDRSYCNLKLVCSRETEIARFFDGKLGLDYRPITWYLTNLLTGWKLWPDILFTLNRPAFLLCLRGNRRTWLNFTFFNGFSICQCAERDHEFSFLFLNLSAVPKISTPGKFAYIEQFHRIEINAP